MQFYIHHREKEDEEFIGEPRLMYTCQLDEHDLEHPRSVHAHNNLVEFLYILSGSGSYEIQGVTYPIRAGDLVIYNNNVEHDETRAENNDLPTLCCAATGIQLEGLPRDCVVPPHVSPVFHLGDRAPAFRRLFQMMFDECSEETARSSEICQSLFLALLRKTLDLIDDYSFEQGSGSVKANILGNRIRTYVYEHALEDLTVQTVAEEFHISTSYLSRIFKQTAGCSLMHYVIRRKIGEAQTLLLTTQLSITEVAQSIGYDNLSHFVKMFTQNVGLSPRKYRKMYGQTPKQGPDREEG